jgi:RNA 3'-terminal phosphate cyclase
VPPQGGSAGQFGTHVFDCGAVKVVISKNTSFRNDYCVELSSAGYSQLLAREWVVDVCQVRVLRRSYAPEKLGVYQKGGNQECSHKKYWNGQG